MGAAASAAPTPNHQTCGEVAEATSNSSPSEGDVQIIGDGIAKPMVSVIVATYNAEILLRPCLENLVRQTMFDRCEILVIDNGSQQNERAIVLEFQQKHPNIRYIHTPRPSLYGAWNLGLRLARGRYWVNGQHGRQHAG